MQCKYKILNLNLGWFKHVGPNLKNKILFTYTLVYLIGLGGLCFSHLYTHS